jgi:autotransporter-associated beta strand protein
MMTKKMLTLASAAIFMFSAGMANAADGTWRGISGAWSDISTPSGVWVGGNPADGVGFTAGFTNVNITADQTINLNDIGRTIGNIIFTDATSASHNLTISGANTLTLDVASGSPTVNVTQSGRTLTISCPIAGSDGLTKSGTGTLILATANTYSGATTVNAGTLQLTHTGALGVSTALTLGNGATLALRSDTTATFATPLASVFPSTTATIDLNNNGSGSGNTVTLSGGLRFENPGSVASTIASINITGGNGYILRTGVSLNPGGNPYTLTLNPTTANVELTFFTNAGGGSPTLVLGGASTGNKMLSTATITGWSYLQKTGTGTWTWEPLLAANFLGGMVVSDGKLIVTGTLRAQSGTQAARNVRINGGELHYNSAGAVDSVYGLLIFGGGNLDNSSGSAITTSTYNPVMQWNANFTFLGSNGTNSDLNLGTGAVTMNASRTVTVNSNATLTVGGAISGAGFGLTKSGTGTLKLGGHNTYSGVTLINNGTLLGVTGGSCSNTAVTVTNTTGITSVLGVVVTDNTKPWVCNNLNVNAVAGGEAQITFSFGVTPSQSQAPLVVRNLLSFSGSSTLVVNPANLNSKGKYPLVTVGGTPPGTVPTLSLTGMTGKLKWEGQTLYLDIPPAGTLIQFF